MPVPHAAVIAVTPVTSTDEKLPGLLEVLAQVPDPRRRRGRRFTLVFMLAVAVVCVLAGAKSFREIGGQAAGLPQDLLAALGGRPHPLRRKIIVPSGKRIRTLVQALDAARLDGDHRRLAARPGRRREARAPADRDRNRREMAARRRGRAGQAVRRDAARGGRDHRPAPHPRRYERDHTGQGAAGPRRPDGCRRHRRRRPRPARHRRLHRRGKGTGLPAERQGQPARTAARHLRQGQRRLRHRPGPRHHRLQPRPDRPPLPLGHRCRRHRLPARRPGHEGPPRHLRPDRNRPGQGSRARHHQPGPRPRHPRHPRRPHPGTTMRSPQCAATAVLGDDGPQFSR